MVKNSQKNVGTIKGPIGEEFRIAYAIAATYHLDKEISNKYAVACKLCAARLLPGEGQRVYIASLYAGNKRAFYACSRCQEFIAEQRSIIVAEAIRRQNS